MASLASFVRSVACCFVGRMPPPRRRGGGANPGGGQAARHAHLRRQRGRAWLLEPTPSAASGAVWTSISAAHSRQRSSMMPSKVQFVRSRPPTASGPAIEKIDVLSRNSTWTLSRETELGLAFVGVNFYDGQALMVRRARNVTTALDLDGSKICVQAGTTTELNLRDFFKANGMKYEAVAAPGLDDARKAYEDGRCDVLTADASALHGERLKTARADDHDILPELLSKEPLGPVVRQDDFRWFNIVKWMTLRDA